MSDDRATCWSITINNPEDKELECIIPGWKLKGQFEQGEEGTRHFQGILKTPQVRFKAVKRAFPRAHIEQARNAKALALYCSKEETRVATFEASGVPSIYEYQGIVASRWTEQQFDEFKDMYHNKHIDDVAMIYLDSICSQMIREGHRAIEFIAINPMWRSSWKKFYRSIIARHASSSSFQSPPPPDEEALPQGTQGQDLHAPDSREGSVLQSG